MTRVTKKSDQFSIMWSIKLIRVKDLFLFELRFVKKNIIQNFKLNYKKILNILKFI